MTGAIKHTKSCTVFTGDGVDVFAMLALASGLELYAKAKIIPNRAYTPTAMLKAANNWTGCKFRRGQYMMAAQALRAKAAEVRSTLQETH